MYSILGGHGMTRDFEARDGPQREARDLSHVCYVYDFDIFMYAVIMKGLCILCMCIYGARHVCIILARDVHSV